MFVSLLSCVLWSVNLKSETAAYPRGRVISSYSQPSSFLLKPVIKLKRIKWLPREVVVWRLYVSTIHICIEIRVKLTQPVSQQVEEKSFKCLSFH